MEEFKLYSISDEYIEWLRKDYPNVYSRKINPRSCFSIIYKTEISIANPKMEGSLANRLSSFFCVKIKVFQQCQEMASHY